MAKNTKKYYFPTRKDSLNENNLEFSNRQYKITNPLTPIKQIFLDVDKIPTERKFSCLNDLFDDSLSDDDDGYEYFVDKKELHNVD